jgi:hypothetical protein
MPDAARVVEATEPVGHCIVIVPSLRYRPLTSSASNLRRLPVVLASTNLLRQRVLQSRRGGRPRRAVRPSGGASGQSRRSGASTTTGSPSVSTRVASWPPYARAKQRGRGADHVSQIRLSREKRAAGAGWKTTTHVSRFLAISISSSAFLLNSLATALRSRPSKFFSRTLKKTLPSSAEEGTMVSCVCDVTEESQEG